MLRLLLTYLVLLPIAGQAQLFNTYEQGSYVLSANGKRQAGELGLGGGQQLIVRNPHGKNLKFTPGEVASIRLGNKQYITLSGVELPHPVSPFAKPNPEPPKVFVQVLDSGQVMLMSYSYTQFRGGAPTINGTMAGGGSSGVFLYLLRQADSPNVTVMQHTGLGGGNKRFRELLRPYLLGRPDLLKYLDEKMLTESMLPDLIHSLNTGVSYLPPERFPRAEP